ncbi:MAG: type II secretion system protein [Bacilli bacterium]|nr:type II secretion system protein [Bacilli bacterium]
MSKNKGVTIIELLIVIVVMSIIAGFVIINVTSILTNTRIKVDTFNLGTLNSVTEDFAEYKNVTSGDIFVGSSTDYDRMMILVDNGHLERIVVAQQTDASFVWDVDNQTWTLVGGELGNLDGGSTNYIFSTSTLTNVLDDGAVSPKISMWIDNDGYLTNKGGESRLFIPVLLNTYTITVSAALSDGSNGGYGIFFDTYLQNDDEDRDTGYALQFDRGYDSGSLIVRPRTNGSEGSPVWTLKAKNSDLFPTTSEDASWWTDTHQIKIVITNVSETTRKASFYVDNVYFGEMTYNNVISDKDIYTGFRGWGSYPTKFYSISVN